MSYPEERLIPVRSESELKPGLWLLAKQSHPGVEWLTIILRSPGEPIRCPHGDAAEIHGGWHAITYPVDAPGGRVCIEGLRLGIAKGRLFRLDTGIDEEREAIRQRLFEAGVDCMLKGRQLARRGMGRP